jgi:hypothetical protein
MEVIARSRTGFWTAFATAEGAFLNARGAEGATVTVPLLPSDVEILRGDAATCHPHAAALALRGPFVVPPLPTPRRETDEPPPHEWQPAPTDRDEERLTRAA